MSEGREKPSWENAGWEAVIGLEIHVQLNTASKIFSAASTAYGAEPNRQACALDLGMPGTLPVVNAEVIRKATQLGLALAADIAPRSVFARKHYFYPDLPKGYQISQYELPIVGDGLLAIEPEGEEPMTVGVTRAHLEEDAGKSLHEEFDHYTGIDLNRAGTPLVEVVSEPDMRTPRQAAAYMKKLHTLVRYLDISDGNMQEGSFRCDANVSVRRRGETAFGTRTETKNLNSFRFVEKAIAFEIERQIDVLEGGGRVVQETRLFDPEAIETRTMRSKEEAEDYRYFPDPDLLPVVITDTDVERVRAAMPELPEERRARFAADYGLPAYDAGALTASRELADYYEAVLAGAHSVPKLAANWVMGELSAALNKSGLDITASPVRAADLAGLLTRIEDKTISGKIAKDVFEAMWAGEGDADQVIQARGLKQITDTDAIAAMVEQVLVDNPEQVEQYRAGKTKVLGFFVGQVMKASRGKANPAEVNALLKDKLDG